ncbi:hypothetical protein [Bartonella queenslandensis]|uniref:hypothetical protein n=1 Tax=Bartonella queenslandensis TaxID=481138 RepID=UPI001BA5C94A|nr:hypothetical protein [Bartonella queenslandensis]
MSDQAQPWHKLTELSGGKGVKSEWLGFPEEFLALTSSQASAVPCGKQYGCYMNVVWHGPSDIVGICTSDTKQCNRRTLKKSELAIYRIDHKKLATKIAAAIGFAEQVEQIKDQRGLWKFGVLNPQAEYRFPVYCFLGKTASQLDKVINQLCMGESRFLLIAATDTLISDASAQASSRHKSKLISIDDVLAIDAAGKVTAKDSAQTILSIWLETVLPKSAKPGSEYQFPTPAGLTWEQFVFEFTATEMLLVSCGQIQKRLEPEHLKMKDQRSGKRTNQWTILLILAKTGGSLSWQDKDADDKLKKHKQELANKLKQTFGLSEDPLPWSRKENCYKARFTIRADDNVLRQLTG